jgi:hypothetical protein
MNVSFDPVGVAEAVSGADQRVGRDRAPKLEQIVGATQQLPLGFTRGQTTVHASCPAPSAAGLEPGWQVSMAGGAI